MHRWHKRLERRTIDNEEKILAMLDSMQIDIADIKKNNETRFENLEKSQQAIRSDVAKINHDLEPKINAVYEGLSGSLRRNEQADRHEKNRKNTTVTCLPWSRQAVNK